MKQSIECEDLSSGGSSIEYDEDESEDDVPMERPTFIPRSQRVTILQKDNEDIEEVAREVKRKQEEEQRKLKTRSLVAESLAKLTESDKDNQAFDSDSGIPDCEDSNMDHVLEYQAWKVREIKRLHRDTEERETRELERAELLRRRSMTDEERMKEDAALREGNEDATEKPKMNFMQKYYHKGVFYMDQDSIKNQNDVRLKNYHAPTLGDTVDKLQLPEIMRVKNFGKKGRTKYTHLVDQDTTMQGSKRIDSRTDRKVQESYVSRLGGAKLK